MIESFDAELARSSEPPASLQEHDLRSLRAWPSMALAQHPLVEHDPDLGRGLAAIRTRSGDEFSAWDGNVGPSPHLVLDAAVLSATALETWAKCPAQYLFRYVLRVREHDDISDVDELEPRHRGSLVHEVLERLGREHIERRDAQPRLPFDSEVPWAVAASDAAERVADQVFTDFELLGSAPYPLLWHVEKRRIVRDVLRTLASDETAAQLLGVEHKFGRDEQPPFILTLPSGRVLHFSGAIDRVDRLHDRLPRDRLQDWPAREREERARRHPVRPACCSCRSMGSPRRPSSTLTRRCLRATGTCRRRAAGPKSASRSRARSKRGSSRRSKPSPAASPMASSRQTPVTRVGSTSTTASTAPTTGSAHRTAIAAWLRLSSAPEVQPYVELSEVAGDSGDDDD